MIKQTILLSVLSMTAGWQMIAHAAPETVTGKTISQITHYDNSAVIRFRPTQSNSQGCSSGADESVILVWDTVAGRKDMLPMVYQAMRDGRKVSLGLDGCYSNYPNIYRIIFY